MTSKTTTPVLPPGPRVRDVARFALGAILALVAGSSARTADDVRGYFELGRSDTSTEFESTLGQAGQLDSSVWVRRVNVTWTRRLFPHLLIDLGAYYEHDDTTIDQDGFTRDSSASKLRPYVRLALRSDVFLAEAAWYRTDEKFGTDNLATFELVRDTFIGVFGWYPVRLPSLRLELSHVEDRDATRESVDATQNILRVNSEYIPVPSTRLFYRGLLEKQTDQITGSDFQTIAHNGEVRFNDTFFNQIWDLYGSWNGGYRQIEVNDAGTGELVIPVVALTGGYDIDDTPDQGVLTPLPALVDQNTLVGTSINLGLPPPAGDRRARNFGVDLGIVRDVNLIQVWIDRELPVEISRSFRWDIWTSADGQFWNLRSTVAAAPFGPFDKRFQIRFPFVNTRYIKVVVLPLAATVPSASAYPAILVTEMETFLTQSSGSISQTVTNTRNLVQANSRIRLLKSTGFYFETTFYGAENSGSATYWTMSNGLFLQQRFDDVWAVSARVAREDGHEQGGSRVAYVYNALVSSTPLETLRNTLSFSGADTVTGGVRQSSTGVFLNSSATVYQGVDLNVSVGSSHNAFANAPTTDSMQYHVGTTLVPHRTMTINIDLDDRTSTYSARGVPDWQEGVRSATVGIAFSPVSSVYFYASWLYDQRTGQPNRTFDTFAFSWTPFPGGTFHLGLNYTENRNSLYNEDNQTFTPNIRWEFNRRSYLQISYENLRIESDLGSSRQDTLAGILHIGF